jgi:hypothetical protein
MSRNRSASLRVDVADLARLVDSLVGLWRDDAGRHDRSISKAWPHRTGAADYSDLLDVLGHAGKHAGPQRPPRSGIGSRLVEAFLAGVWSSDGDRQRRQHRGPHSTVDRHRVGAAGR